MHILTESQVLNRPDPSWQLRPLWPHGALVTVFGKAGSFKTAAVKGMVFSIAAGIDWFHHPATPGRVLWIAGEGQGGLKNRLLAWKQHHQIPALPALGYCDEPVPLKRDHKDLRAFLEQALLFNPSIVVIDSLSDAMRAAALSDKNTEDMDTAIDAMKLLRDKLQSTILVIHHTGWTNTSRARGGSNLIAAVDTEIYVHPDKNRPDLVILENTKQREAESFPPLRCSITIVDLGENPNGEPQSACVVGGVQQGPISPQKQDITSSKQRRSERLQAHVEKLKGT